MLTRIAVIAVAIVVAGVGTSYVWWDRPDESDASQEHPPVPQLVEALSSQLSDEQEALLADGVLTFEEYEGAIERVAACVEAKRLTVRRFPGAGIGGSTQLQVSSDGSIPFEQGSTWHAECREQHTGKLGMVWAEQHRGEFEASRAQVDACLVAKGADYLTGARFSLAPPEFEAKGWGPGSFEWWAYWTCNGVHADTPAELAAAVEPEKNAQ